MRVAHGYGSFSRRLTQLAKLDVLLLADFALAPVTATERTDLLELTDDRVGSRSTVITNQLPVNAWHEFLAEPTLSDAILGRVVHASHRIVLRGESLRKK